MDVVLDFVDRYFFTPYVYPEWWSAHDPWRQFLTLNLIVDISGALLYLMMASLSYVFLYDKRLLSHPQALQNQVEQEIRYTLWSLPWMGLPTCLLFLGEVRGHSFLYDNVADSMYGWWMVVLSVVTFLLYTDCLIYWIHRGLHHKLIYKHLHKWHHKWKVPTPFASHAFHPMDGFLQSLPYHLYVFSFPMHKFTYLALYVAVNFWTVSIHDGNYQVPKFLQPFINGSAHHMDHHIYYNYNYGQYLTLWDRIGKSFRNPSSFDGKGPLDELLKRDAHKGNGDVDNENSVDLRNMSKKLM